MLNLKALLTFLIFPLIAPAMEFSPLLDSKNCRTIIESSALTAEICGNSTQHEVVTITLHRHDSNRSSLVLQAVFDAKASPLSIGERTPMWRRLWIASGSPIMTEKDQAMIRETIADIGIDSIDFKVFIVLDFIANFVEPNEAVPEYDSKTEEVLLNSRQGTYTMICHLVGQLHVGTYFVDGNAVVSTAVVGDPETRCRGRCGIGCYQFMQWRTSQYTQECFEHDLCHAEVGSMLGPCSDSFWKAYYGYMNAPNCFD